MKPREIQELYDSGKKVTAIKELRLITKCGLAEARDALIAGTVDRLVSTGNAQVYLRELDHGTDNACWVVCAKGDPGSVMFIPA